MVFLPFFLGSFLMAATLPDSASYLPEGPYLRSIRISHHPPDVIIINRPYDLDLFAGFPEDSIENVSIFMKLEGSQFFREIPLTPEYGRYRYTVEAIPDTGITLSYFFTLTLKGYGIHVIPTPVAGEMAQPVTRTTISPIEYFRQRRTRR